MKQVLTYHQCGDYLLPDIEISITEEKPLGKYGRMMRTFSSVFVE